jgi:hypothetical protein
MLGLIVWQIQIIKLLTSNTAKRRSCYQHESKWPKRHHEGTTICIKGVNVVNLIHNLVRLTYQFWDCQLGHFGLGCKEPQFLVVNIQQTSRQGLGRVDICQWRQGQNWFGQLERVEIVIPEKVGTEFHNSEFWNSSSCQTLGIISLRNLNRNQIPREDSGGVKFKDWIYIMHMSKLIRM